MAPRLWQRYYNIIYNAGKIEIGWFRGNGAVRIPRLDRIPQIPSAKIGRSVGDVVYPKFAQAPLNFLDLTPRPPIKSGPKKRPGSLFRNHPKILADRKYYNFLRPNRRNMAPC